MTQQVGRAEEIARVRGYLVAQAAKRTPAELVETLREAHAELLQALERVPETAFRTAPAAEEWSAADVLAHVRSMALYDATAIPNAISAGTAPNAGIRDQIEPAPSGATRAQLLGDLNDAREKLIAAALAADPEAHLDVRWPMSDFGALNWREALLFARVHTLDHARQMAAIAATVDRAV
jgi:hypothetical protein